MWHANTDGYVLWDKNEFPKSEFDRRHSELASAAKRDGVDAILVYSDKSKPGDACYVTNYVGPYGNQRVVIVRPNGKITFIVDAAERDLPRVQAPSYVEDVRVSKNPVDEAAKILMSEGGMTRKRIGLAGNRNRTAFVHESLQSKLPGIEIDSGPRFDDILWSLRLAKKKSEIERLRQSAQTLQKAYSVLVSGLKEGESETHVTATADRLMRLGEAEDLGVLLASGRIVSRLPSPLPSERTFSAGDMVLISLAMQYRHYWAEMSRTVVIGENDAAASLYRVALAARESARRMIRPGIRAKHIALEVSRIFGENGVHQDGGFGAGIGIDLEERPSLTATDETPLMPGMVLRLSLAPRNDKVRVVLGDMFLVTASGNEILTPQDVSLAHH